MEKKFIGLKNYMIWGAFIYNCYYGHLSYMMWIAKNAIEYREEGTQESFDELVTVGV